jgi:hypothetical protein
MFRNERIIAKFYHFLRDDSFQTQRKNEFASSALPFVTSLALPAHERTECPSC